MAGADRMYDALFAQTGVIRAQTFADLLDVPAALATGRHLRGKRVAILTSTGGAGTLVSDALGVSGFEAPAPDEATAAARKKIAKKRFVQEGLDQKKKARVAARSSGGKDGGGDD
jgi:acyl-CoA synthetase (NDP forming)